MLSRRDLVASLGAAAFIRPSLAWAAPADSGAWSPEHVFPIVNIHLNLLPNGKVLGWQDDNIPGLRDRNPDYAIGYVYTIPTDGAPQGNPLRVENRRTNLFCSGHCFLADGRLFITGGHNGRDYYGEGDVNVFDSSSNTFQTISRTDLREARWYGSAITLGDGTVLVMGGTMNGPTTLNPLPQVWLPDQEVYRDLTGAQLRLKNYPRIYLLDDGRVVHIGAEQQNRFLDASGIGGWTNGPRRNYSTRVYGTAAMYGPDKFLIVGGSNQASTPPTNTAEVIDFNGDARWRYTSPMRFPRRHANAVLLPDGTVLVVGGTSSTSFNGPEGRILTPELWNPVTGTWSVMAVMTIPALYHSTAILLPDGRVLMCGGGRGARGRDYRRGQIFSPPYLFRRPRPVVTGIPAEISYGQAINFQTPAQIAKVRLIRLGSTTHTFDMNARVLPLDPTPTRGGFSVTIPTNRNALPPGHYMFFCVSTDGVPSIAPIVRVA